MLEKQLKIIIMETSRTDRVILVNGLKKMGVALVCMFLGPTMVYMAFSNKEKPLYIPILILGIIICITAIAFAFKGINTIMNSMFNKK